MGETRQGVGWQILTQEETPEMFHIGRQFALQGGILLLYCISLALLTFPA